MYDRSDPIFTDEVAARHWLEARRWPNGAQCPWCAQRDTVHPLAGKAAGTGWYHCRHCRRKFTVRVGTIYERSHVPLNKWLLAEHILSSENPRAITIELLGARIGVSYRTAWRMMQQLRRTAETPAAQDGS